MTEIPTFIRHRRIASVIQSHPVIGFFTLAITFSWSVWLPLFLIVPSPTSVVMMPGAFGPALAAVFVVWLRCGSLRDWLIDGLDWRIGRQWYLIALGLPIVLALTLGAGLVVVTGQIRVTRLTPAVTMYPVLLLLTTLLGGGQEEFGWRGFALPALQARFDALTASVVIGIVWAAWHLPAFVFEIPGYTRSFAVYAFLVVGISIILTWLYNNTGGSILLAMLLHGGINAAPSLGVVFVGEEPMLSVSPYVFLVAAVWIVALALLARYGRETLSSGSAITHTAQESAGRNSEASI